MKIEVLKAFLTVAEASSVSEASEILYVSQSTVSRYIQELEKELNSLLFVRSKNGIRMTRAGMVIYGQVRRLVDDWEQIRLAASRYGSQEGMLRIGYVFPGILSYISKTLESGSKALVHDFNFSLIYGQAKELCMMVINDALDCVVLHRPSVMQSPELYSIKIASTFMSIMVHNSHPLANQKSISMAQISRETESRAERDPEFFEAVDNAFFQTGLKPPVHVAASEPADCYLAIQHKGYFCFRCSCYPPEDGFSVIPIEDWPVDYDLMMVCGRQSHNAATDFFYQMLKQQFSNEN